MTTTDTRRGFLNGLLIVAGGAAAAALSACSAPADARTRTEAPVPAAGATEVLETPPGVTYDNVMPNHVATVRLRATTYVPDWSTSKRS
jgi:hypothetical protein